MLGLLRPSRAWQCLEMGTGLGGGACFSVDTGQVVQGKQNAEQGPGCRESDTGWLGCVAMVSVLVTLSSPRLNT